MANTNAPYGFVGHRHMAGGTERLSNYRLASAYATAIFFGDLVALASDGTIGTCTAGSRILGVFQGAFYTATDGTPTFVKNWTASVATLGSDYARAVVSDDPKMLYRAQSGGTPAVTNIGNLADHVVGTGNTATGMSGSTVSGTMGTGAAGLRIVDIVDAPDNEIGQYADLIVQIFEHELEEHSQATPGV